MRSIEKTSTIYEITTSDKKTTIRCHAYVIKDLKLKDVRRIGPTDAINFSNPKELPKVDAINFWQLLPL